MKMHTTFRFTRHSPESAAQGQGFRPQAMGFCLDGHLSSPVGCLFLWSAPGTTCIVLCLRSPALPLRSELSSPRVSLNANEHSRENGNSSICHAWTPAFAGVTFLLDSTPQILAGPGESTAYDPGSF